jgi:hypothetical protein
MLPRLSACWVSLEFGRMAGGRAPLLPTTEAAPNNDHNPSALLAAM